MAEDNEKSTLLPWSKPTVEHIPMCQSGEVNLAGKVGGAVDADRYVMVNIDRTPPPAEQWLKDAVAQMKDAPDPPQSPTETARRLVVPMRNAFVRHQVDKALTAGSLMNVLRDLDWFGWFKKAHRGDQYPKNPKT